MMCCRRLLVGLVVVAMWAVGCGYHLTGTGTGLPSHIRSIAIPIFANNSTEPEIELSLTEAVRDEFIEDNWAELYDHTVTICHAHHLELHKIYGRNPGLGTAEKQMRWVEIQREKHGMV